MIKKILVITPFILFTSCASINGYNWLMKSWVNKKQGQLIKAWGYPDRTFKNGSNTVFHYMANLGTHKTNTTHTVANGLLGPTVISSGGDTVNVSCQSFFEIDKTQTIIGYSFKGNACKSKYSENDYIRDNWEELGYDSIEETEDDYEGVNCFLPEYKDHKECVD